MREDILCRRGGGWTSLRTIRSFLRSLRSLNGMRGVFFLFIQSTQLKRGEYFFSAGGHLVRRGAERLCVSYEVKRRKLLMRLTALQNIAALKRIQRILFN